MCTERVIMLFSPITPPNDSDNVNSTPACVQGTGLWSAKAACPKHNSFFSLSRLPKGWQANLSSRQRNKPIYEICLHSTKPMTQYPMTSQSYLVGDAVTLHCMSQRRRGTDFPEVAQDYFLRVTAKFGCFRPLTYGIKCELSGIALSQQERRLYSLCFSEQIHRTAKKWWELQVAYFI